VGPQGDEGSQHRRCQGAGSGNHPIHQRGCLLWPRAICSGGMGAQGGLHLPEYLINAPRGAGSRRYCQR
jgi:hypothetical protein